MFLGQEMHYYIVCIAYYAELNLQIAITRKYGAFVAKKVNTRLTKVFMAIFATDVLRLLASAQSHKK